MSGSGISWAICKSAPCSRQLTMPAPHHSVFHRPDALPATQPTASKHWRQRLAHDQYSQPYLLWGSSNVSCEWSPLFITWSAIHRMFCIVGNQKRCNCDNSCLEFKIACLAHQSNKQQQSRLTALVQDYPGEPVPERYNKSGFYWSKRQWVAVASAGQYASLHLAPDR